MSNAKKFYWLKLGKDFFKRHDIRIIESMENGKDYALFYLKLLLESISHEGELRFNDAIPYNEKMLSTITYTNVDIVRSAIKVLKSLGLLEIWDDETIYLTETNKMLGFETEWARKKRAQREKAKKIAAVDNVPLMSLESPPNVRQEIDIEKELEKDIDIEKELEKELETEEPKGSMSVKTDPPSAALTTIESPIKINFKELANYWNERSGLKPIHSMTQRRKDFIKIRVANHGLEAIYIAIDNCNLSSFMKGDNDRNWFATFDWVFGNPQNFIKTLEGNYVNTNNTKNQNSNLVSRASRLKEKYGGE